MKLPVSKSFCGWFIVNLLFVLILVDVIVAKKSFYEIVVALSSSKLAVVLFYGAMVANAWGGFLVIRWLCFGKLTPSENVAVYDNFYFKCIEMIINITIFEQMDSGILWKFSIFLALKVLHDCATARLGTLESAAVPNKKSIVKLTWVLWLFFVVDVISALHYFNNYLARGVDVHITLLLDSAMMATVCFDLAAKVFLFVSDDGGDTSGVRRFYLTFLVRVTQCVFLITFSIVALSVASMPIYVMRQLILGLRNMVTALDSFAKYRRLALQIDAKFPKPEQADIDRDDQCVICYDSIQTVDSAKKLPCGHIYHRGCLRRWFEKKSSCPYCRRELDEAKGIFAAANGRRDGAAAAAAAPLQPAAQPQRGEPEPAAAAAAAAPPTVGNRSLADPPMAAPPTQHHRVPPKEDIDLQTLYEAYRESFAATGQTLEDFMQANGLGEAPDTTSLAQLMEEEAIAHEQLRAARERHDAIRSRLVRRIAVELER